MCVCERERECVNQCERSRQRQKFRPAETALTILEADPCIYQTQGGCEESERPHSH